MAEEVKVPTANRESSQGYVCPICNKPFSRAQVLGRHKFLEHPELREQEKLAAAKKTEEIVSTDSVTDGVRLAYQLLDNVARMAGLSPELLSAMRDQDLRLRLAMNLVAQEKCRRMIDLYDSLKELEVELKTRTSDMEQVRKMSTHELCSLQERITRMIHEELQYMQTVGYSATGPQVANEVVVTEIAKIQSRTSRAGCEPFVIPSDPQVRELLRLQSAKELSPELAQRMGLPVVQGVPIQKTIDVKADVKKE
jgi:hypothetical protein